MLRHLAAAALIVLAALPLHAKCAPKHVLRIVMSAEIPGVEAGAFATRPKTMYRLGEKFGRIEEEKNPENGLHMLVIVSEPDVWMVNRADKTGQHVVDSGPTYMFRAPIIGGIESEHWKNFEFGCEVPFMKAVKSAPRELADGKRVYEHTHEGITARVFVDKNDIPQRVELAGRDTDLALRYSAYEQLADAPKDLFEKPAGVDFTENPTP